MSENYNELFMDVYKIKTDMHQLNNLIERLDTTIEKLTEVSTSISQLLAVQSTRLEHLEKMSTELSQEMTEQDRNIHNQIYKLEKEVYREMESNQSMLLSEIKSIREDNEKQHDILWKKVDHFQKWIWVVSGGAVVVGFIIEKFLIKFL